MSDLSIIPYFNDILARLEELLYHELSKTAHKKVEFSGIDFLRSRKITGNSLEEVVSSCVHEITSSGLAQEIHHSVHGYGVLLCFEVKGCIHLSKEEKLKESGIEPYMCPLANMIGDRLIEILNYEVVHVANMEIDHEKSKCIVKYAVFENAYKVGAVSDWASI